MDNNQFHVQEFVLGHLSMLMLGAAGLMIFLMIRDEFTKFLDSRFPKQESEYENRSRESNENFKKVHENHIHYMGYMHGRFDKFGDKYKPYHKLD